MTAISIPASPRLRAILIVSISIAATAFVWWCGETLDALTITLIAIAILLPSTPFVWRVAWNYYSAWRGGETIPYFAPTMALIVSFAIVSTVVLAVGAASLFSRATGIPLIPGGVGLLSIAFGFVVPDLVLVWLWRQLRSRR